LLFLTGIAKNNAVDIISILGNSTLVFLIAMGLGILVLLLLMVIYLKTGRIFFRKFFVFLADVLDSPVKALFWVFRVDDEIVDRAYVEIQNTIVRDRFKAVPFNQRVMFLPQCSRHRECRALLTGNGIKCLKCGRCVLGQIIEEGDKLGYKSIYIVPGSSFIRRLVKAEKPGAVIGVACLPEVKQGIQMLNKYSIPVQGIPLLRPGCIDTIVDKDKVIEIMRLSQSS
jgi:hypothetical protein